LDDAGYGGYEREQEAKVQYLVYRKYAHVHVLFKTKVIFVPKFLPFNRYVRTRKVS